MIDEIAHEEFTEMPEGELIEEVEQLPLTNGYVKVKAIDFDTLNNEWTVKANLMGVDCEPYTRYFPDNNPEFAWAKIEHDGITDLTVVSYEDAVAQGLKVEVYE